MEYDTMTDAEWAVAVAQMTEAGRDRESAGAALAEAGFIDVDAGRTRSRLGGAWKRYWHPDGYSADVCHDHIAGTYGVEVFAAADLAPTVFAAAAECGEYAR